MKKQALLFIFLSFAVLDYSWAARHYVNWIAPGNNDGSSWFDAFTSIKTAINAASAGDTIFVAGGLYPSSSGDKNQYIGLKQGVVIFGCLVGNEDPITQDVLNARDYETNTSLLLGDLYLNDAGGGSTEENTYHVVVAKGTGSAPIDSTTVLDGFFIYGGNATGDTDSTSVGGGVYLSAVDGGQCNPTLKGLIIFGNYAKEGGGMMLYAATGSECSPTLDSVLFRGNYADGGGGLYCKALGGTCNPKLHIVDFNYNSLSGVYPGKGAAIFNYAENTTSAAECSPVINTSEISHNECTVDGGAVYSLAGGINPGTCNPAFINISFYKNGSYGIYNKINKGTCIPELTNVILWNETINNMSGVSPAINHCIIEGSNGSGPGWSAVLGTDGGGNLDADPLWADPDGRNFRLLAGSPALGAGDGIEGINIGSYQGGAAGEPSKIIILGAPGYFGNVALGQVSAEQSYAVKGTNLLGDIFIQAPDGFAITTTSGDYSGDTTSVTLAQSGGTVDSTQIYVRFSPTIEKPYFNVLMHASAGAADKYIVVEGNCYDGPEISVTGIVESFDSVLIYEYSTEQSFTVESFDLTSEISVSAPGGFEISLISGDYSGDTEMINLEPAGGRVAPTEVYVRFAPDKAKHYADNILIRSTDADARQIYVQGLCYELANLMVSGTITDFGPVLTGHYSGEQSFSVEGKNLVDDIIVKSPEGFQITLASGDYSGITDSLSLVMVVDSVVPTTVFTRFAPQDPVPYEGSIQIYTPGAEAKSLDVSGEGASKPELSSIDNIAVCEGESIGDLQVEITDIDVNSVTLEALSANADLIPAGSVTITGTGGTRTIGLDPNEGQTGNSGISIIATNSFMFKDTVTFTLTVNPNPVIVDFAITDESAGNDGEIAVTATSAAGGLQYSLDDGTFQSASTFTGLSEGTYKITVSDANGCESSDNAAVGKITGIFDLSDAKINVYPVPSRGILYVNGLNKLAGSCKIAVYNNSGELVYITGNKDIKYIDLTGFSKGLYMLKLYNGNKLYIEKFAIE
jgi:predicted outer membrane repeat protein